MSTKTYDTLGLTLTVRSDGTSVSVGFSDSIAIVGGYDATNAGSSVSPNSAETITSASDAANKFGDGSELHEASKLALNQGVGDIRGVAVAETTGTTDSFSSTQSGSLSNTPVFDPTVNREHSIVASDSNSNSIDVQIDYDDSPSAPSSSDTINLNPSTGNWKADAAGTYDITYDYGDYTSGIQEAVGLDVRYVIVLTENDSVTSTLSTELSTRASNFDFKRGVVGVHPEVASNNIGSHTPNEDDQRIVRVAPARGTVDEEVRLAAGVGALAASVPVGDSITYDTVGGLTNLRTKYLASEADDASRITVLTSDYEVAEGVTTSSTAEFQDIHKVEIVDTVAQALHEIAKTYAGGPNIADARKDLRSDMVGTLGNFASQRPPLLATGDGTRPYSVTTSQGASDDEMQVEVGIEPLPIAKEVTLDLAVGNVVTFNGASA